MNATSNVGAERELAKIGRWTVGDNVALPDYIADLHQRARLMQVDWLERWYFISR